MTKDGFSGSLLREYWLKIIMIDNTAVKVLQEVLLLCKNVNVAMSLCFSFYLRIRSRGEEYVCV